jgi:hypothetical protein
MNNPSIKVLLGAGASLLFLSGCAYNNPFGSADERWADFKTWTKVTEGREPTGDPTGTLELVHEGPNGYRDVYVNDIGKAVLMGEPPYKFPAGTVVVKEQFENKADWEAQKGASVTVAVKVADDGNISGDNWQWAAGYKAKAGASDFCSTCHIAAITPIYQSDYVFTTADFLAKHPQ